IDGKEVRTGTLVSIHPPHELAHTLGQYHKGDETHIKLAIDSALAAHETWEAMGWEHRASIFLKAAELLAGPYRARMNAATMLGQSKNAYQAEIDAACELIDFFRFNVQYMSEIYSEQPQSAKGIWNRLEYRPLEGFVLAITPFNFTSIAGNLPAAPALMGNVVVWKPAETQIYSAWVIMELLREAGLPAGVINLIYADGPTVGDICFKHTDFAGIHFTGSTGTFQKMWKMMGENIGNYKTYPRIVGETGGKDFVIAHKSADAKAVATALARGAFEYQGQKCSAASRAYIPSNLWDEIREQLLRDIKSFKMGPVEDFSNFINAVIDEKSFDKIAAYIEGAKNKNGVTILTGGNCDKSVGYFIEPTVLLAERPDYVTMCEEIFGPVLTVYVYPEDEFEKTLEILDKT
ncbi:MAG TPA: aldehyde dehydrogenase family protein, partial [Flavobacterium sp.]|nr:aldehyde dehydrogenase family protein [Flavobacterium sp.]